MLLYHLLYHRVIIAVLVWDVKEIVRQRRICLRHDNHRLHRFRRLIGVIGEICGLFSLLLMIWFYRVIAIQ